MSDKKEQKSLELPQYSSNKVYGALAIESVRPVKNGGAIIVLVPEDADKKVDQVDREVEVDRHFVKAHNPTMGNYFTIDEDGNFGYIKKEVFEEDYVPYQGTDQAES